MNSKCKKNDRLLIVDDTLENIQVLGHIFRQENYKFNVAMSGVDALKIVEKVAFDMILLDVMMPQMDGFEVCRRLKMKKETSEIPIIFLTAKSETESMLGGFEIGAVDYVIKPFKRKELLSRIKVHLDLRRSKRNLEQALEEIKILRGNIPICAACKKIRDDEGLWNQIETYIESHTEALFTHSLCSDCEKQLYGDQEWFKKRKDKNNP